MCEKEGKKRTRASGLHWERGGMKKKWSEWNVVVASRVTRLVLLHYLILVPCRVVNKALIWSHWWREYFTQCKQAEEKGEYSGLDGKREGESPIWEIGKKTAIRKQKKVEANQNFKEEIGEARVLKLKEKTLNASISPGIIQQVRATQATNTLGWASCTFFRVASKSVKL